MKNDTSALDLVPADAGAMTAATPAKMMEAVIAKGITAESVDVMERLIAMKERLDAKDAERAFNAAFVKLQAELPEIIAKRIVPNNDGSPRYRFADFETIMDALREPLKANGFAVSFSMSFDGTNNVARVIQTCTVRHIAGHSQSNSFAARVGKGPPSSSEAQGDGAASTYAKRFALCNAFNIVIEQDTDGAPGTDARNEGELITFDKVKGLKELVAEVGYKEDSFLKLAGVTKYEEIREGSYGVLCRAIEMKRNANKKAP